jgi:hypothetical protein
MHLLRQPPRPAKLSDKIRRLSSDKLGSLVHSLVKLRKIQRSVKLTHALIDLDSIAERKASRFFRFSISEIREMSSLLELPETFRSKTCRVSNDIALAMLLCRLSGCRSYFDIGNFFGCDASTSCRIVCGVIDFLVERWDKILTCNVDRLKKMAPEFASTIKNKGCLLDNCIGFVDGTNRETCRPGVVQQVFYSGHKHYHSLKYQSLTTPDGLISHFFGPFPGSKHDMSMYDTSGLEEIMTEHLDNFLVFGDQGYTNRRGHLRCPNSGLPEFLEDDELEFNRSMLEPRLSVEWGFMLVSQNWQLFQRPAYLRIQSRYTGNLYRLAVFFTNLLTCFRGRNQITDFFGGCAPPTPSEYLGLL